MQKITRSYLLKNPLPDHHDAGDKEHRGRVLVIAGSVEIPGAAMLASIGALRAGAGILQIATCATSAPNMRIAMPEAMVAGCEETAAGGIHPSAAGRLVQLASECDAVLLGPGMVDEDAVAELTLALLKNVSGPCFVLDAAAFVQMRAHPEVLKAQGGRVVVTPHSGEMAQFLEKERADVDREAEVSAKSGFGDDRRGRRSQGSHHPYRRCFRALLVVR